MWNYRIVVSKTYEVYDCIFHEDGTKSDPTTNWRLGIGSNGSFDRYDEYTTISDNNNTTTGVVYFIADGNNNLQLPQNVFIELDIQRVDGSATSNILSPRANGIISNYPCSLNAFGITDTDWHTVQLRLTPTRISRMVDGVEITAQNISETINYWVFGLWTSIDITEINFRNVKVYPI